MAHDLVFRRAEKQHLVGISCEILAQIAIPQQDDTIYSAATAPIFPPIKSQKNSYAVQQSLPLALICG